MDNERVIEVDSQGDDSPEANVVVAEVSDVKMADTRPDDRGYEHQLQVMEDRVAYLQDGDEKAAFYFPSGYQYFDATFRVVETSVPGDENEEPTSRYTFEVALYYGQARPDGSYPLDLGPLGDQFDFIPDETPTEVKEPEGPKVIQPRIR